MHQSVSGTLEMVGPLRTEVALDKGHLGLLAEGIEALEPLVRLALALLVVGAHKPRPRPVAERVGETDRGPCGSAIGSKFGGHGCGQQGRLEDEGDPGDAAMVNLVPLYVPASSPSCSSALGAPAVDKPEPDVAMVKTTGASRVWVPTSWIREGLAGASSS